MATFLHRPARVVIENVEPAIDGGRFAIKRVVSDRVTVTAEIHADGHDELRAVVCNFTPVARSHYRLGVPRDGLWTERLNSDARGYGGGGWGSFGGVEATPVPAHDRPYSLTLTLPGLAALFFTSEARG